MPKHFRFDKKYDLDYSCLLCIQLVIAIFIKIIKTNENNQYGNDFIW